MTYFKHWDDLAMGFNEEREPMLHSLILFLHVSSAMGIIAAFGIEGVIVRQLRDVGGDARTVLGTYRYIQRVGGVSLILAVLSGAYLATVYWQWSGAWMGVGFLTVIAIAVVGATLTGVPVARVMRGGTDRDLSGKLAMSFAIRIALFFGLVFLMTVKPTTPLPALVTILVAAAIGFVIGVPARFGAKPAPNEQAIGR